MIALTPGIIADCRCCPAPPPITLAQGRGPRRVDDGGPLLGAAIRREGIMPWRRLPEAPRHVLASFRGKARILADESLGQGVALLLRDRGCNVEFVGDVGLAGKAMMQLLRRRRTPRSKIAGADQVSTGEPRANHRPEGYSGAAGVENEGRLLQVGAARQPQRGLSLPGLSLPACGSRWCRFGERAQPSRPLALTHGPRRRGK